MTAGVLIVGGLPALGAPVCILNSSSDSLLLIVDDNAGNRLAQVTKSGDSLCLEAGKDIVKARVGVFVDEDAQEGCSRLTRPGQLETLIGFAEFDNCEWVETDRNF